MSDYVEYKESGHLTSAGDRWEIQHLGPFSLGVRVLWESAVTADDSTSFAGAAVVWLCLELGKYFDAFMAMPGAEVESAWYMAKTSLQRACEGRSDTRRKVLSFIEEMPSKEVLLKCAVLGGQILKKAETSRPESEPNQESEGLGLGESQAAGYPPKPSKLSLSKKKTGKGKKR